MVMGTDVVTVVGIMAVAFERLNVPVTIGTTMVTFDGSSWVKTACTVAVFIETKGYDTSGASICTIGEMGGLEKSNSGGGW